jgi:hypothetical protein
VVSTERLTFALPGASANLNGSYNLSSGNVHLVGSVRMDSDIFPLWRNSCELILLDIA